MAETANIAEFAKKVAEDLFGTFLWKTRGPRDTNWPCEEPDTHGKRRRKKLRENESDGEPETDRAQNPDPAKAEVTHPTDIVFYYDEPYSSHRTYINCDLKSYAASTIQKTEVRKAVESLARALTCLEKSSTWRTRFVEDDKAALYAGMLFVYNHDGEFTSHFDEFLASISFSNLDIPRNSKLIVLGPHEIFWLANVSDEILRMRGKGHVGPPESCRFFYPPLVLAKNVQPSACAATIEMLTGPWIILKHRRQGFERDSVLIFYRGRGERVEEFSMLFDYLMFHGLVEDGVEINVRTLMPDPEASAQFTKAIDDYIRCIGGGPEISKLLKDIRYESMTQVRRVFSETEIGMTRGA